MRAERADVTTQRRMSVRVVRSMAVLLLFHVIPAQAVSSWSGKTVQYIQPDSGNADCFYFTLSGVSEADPIKPGNAWFGVNRATHPGSKDLFAMLLTAKLTATPISVLTSGTIECGYAGVNYAFF